MAGCTQQVARSGRDDGGEPPSRGYGTAGRLALGDRGDPRLARLVQTIEGEIIPRLMLAHRAAARVPSVPGGDTSLLPTPREISEFGRIVIARSAAVASSYVDTLLARGMTLDTLFLHLLAPTARRLGEMWAEDECDFTAVTIGLWRLQQVMRQYATAFVDEGEPREHGRRALLVPVPGEQHTFGIAMVAEFFRRAGWDVWSGPFATVEDLVDTVRSDWYAVIGLSASCEARIDALAATIRAVRRGSKNRAIGVLVGGPLFADHPERVALVGADATATDGRQAAQQAESLLGLLNAPAAAGQG